MCLISKGHSLIIIPMPDIYADNVTKRTREYAGSHSSNVVCMNHIFSSA